MSNKKAPARTNDVILHQFLKIIPKGMAVRIARETGVDAKARTFSDLSHATAMKMPPALKGRFHAVTIPLESLRTH